MGWSSTRSATTRWETSWTCSRWSTARPTSSSTASCPPSSGWPCARCWTGKERLSLQCWPPYHPSSRRKCKLSDLQERGTIYCDVIMLISCQTWKCNLLSANTMYHREKYLFKIKYTNIKTKDRHSERSTTTVYVVMYGFKSYNRSNS